MTKYRIFFFFLTLIVVGAVSFLILLYAKGYRFNQTNQTLEPHGLLVIKSDPDSAQILINGEVKTATNATLSLAPGSYDISIKKEGFQTWDKRLTITEGEVTETTAHLFKIAPSLTPITFNGAENPVISNDAGKLAFAVPQRLGDNTHNTEIAGLYILENVDLPIGFSREARRITDADTVNGNWIWAPDDKEILLINSKDAYVLDTTTFTSQTELINGLSGVDLTMSKWQSEYQKRFQSQIKALPLEVKDVLERKTKQVIFSPDNDMILYTASGSATLSAELIKPIPGSSTQKEDRDIKDGKTYIYDIKEDKNFLILDTSNGLVTGHTNQYSNFGFQNSNTSLTPTPKPLAISTIIENWKLEISNFNRRLAWFPTSRHIILTETDKITIMDYDGTNKKEVYSGSFVTPFVFPSLSLNRLIILTNFGAASSTPNLYSLSVK